MEELCMDGILVVDKPRGITSYQVVRKVKKLIGAAKVGHGGTLDPLATGVLPVFLNRATKLASFLTHGTKKYRATMKLGVETDTQDRDGTIISESTVLPTDPQHITDVLNALKGPGEQIPPMFSAVKFRGTPLYKLARKGISLERKARTIFIHEMTVLDIHLPYVTFEVTCSPGTYVRTLCADSGKKLVCGAHLVELTRLQSGNFHLEDSINLNQLHSISKENGLHNTLFSLSASFSDLPHIRVEQDLFTLLKERRTLPASLLMNTSPTPLQKGTLLKVTCLEDSLTALVQSHSTNTTSAPATDRAWKLVCFFNPQENTIH
jgi:tRNA pseudouridine55 synthase